MPVSAGNGVFPDEITVVEHIPVIRSDIDYAVRVVGDSMEPIAPNGIIDKIVVYPGGVIDIKYKGLEEIL